MSNLADGDKRRQGVADHRQSESPQHRMAERAKFEGQLRHVSPAGGLGSQPVGQGSHCQDRGGEGPVVSIHRRDRRCDGVRLERAAGPGDVGLGLVGSGAVGLAGMLA